MNAFYSLLLVALSFSLGVIVGEVKAPINGITVQALAARTAALEQRLNVLSMKYDELSLAFFGPADGRDAGR